MKNRVKTTEAAAAYIGISARTLYRWKAKGIGPVSRKMGGLVRYRQEDLDMWLEGGDRA